MSRREPWGAVLVVLAACGGDGDGARGRCDRALERSRDMDPAEVSLRVAHACASLFTGRCRETMRNIEDYSTAERLDRLVAACGDQLTRVRALKPKGRTPHALDEPPRTPRVVVHVDHLDIERSPQDRRTDLSCDALAAALDGVPRPVIELQPARDAEYAKVVETMDCLVRHGFEHVGLVP